MTKDVLVTISGLHYNVGVELPAEQNEPIEILAPAVYYFRDGRHYVLYEEPVEGMPGVIRSRIKFREGEMLEITKSGLANTRMLFVKDKIHVSQYQTPYGEMLVSTYTNELDIEVEEREIRVYVRYALDIGGDKIADCDIRIKIQAK